MKNILTFFLLLSLLCSQAVHGQDYLQSATNTATGTTTDNSTAWTNLTSVTIDLGTTTTYTKYVMVTASMNMRPDGVSTDDRIAAYNIYRSDDDTDNSGTIYRQVNKGDETGVEYWGIGSLVYIFDVTSLSDSKTYTIEHSNQGTTGANTNFYSSVCLTAMALSAKKLKVNM